MLIFVIGIPALMWLVSGRSWPYVPDSAVQCIISLILVVLAKVILLTLQVRSEEKRLTQDFGQEYLDYKKRVGRYFPW